MPFGLSSEVGSAVSVATCCKGSEGATGRTKEHPTACAVSKCSSILARPGHAGRSTSTRRRRSARLKPYLAASVTEQRSRYFSRCVCKFTSSAAPPSCPEMQENGLRIAGPVFSPCERWQERLNAASAMVSLACGSREACAYDRGVLYYRARLSQLMWPAGYMQGTRLWMPLL